MGQGVVSNGFELGVADLKWVSDSGQMPGLSCGSPLGKRRNTELSTTEHRRLDGYGDTVGDRWWFETRFSITCQACPLWVPWGF